MAFITFEGMDGSGKTTQAKLLVANLQKLGIRALYTREPGGTPLAEDIRNLVLNQSIDDPITEFLLIAAARRDHVMNFIKHSLEQGNIVVCDRFIDSSVLYQGYCKQMDISLIHAIHQRTVEGFMPEITVLVDVSVEVARLRLQERSDGASNHYDTRGVAFHQNIYNGLHSLAADNAERFVVIDGQGAQELVAANILQVICSKLKIGLEI